MECVRIQQSAESVFRKQKEQCLSAIDLSRKGSVDEPIRELVQFINQQENYVTTSSCSGRIVVFSYPSGEVKKKGCDWLFMSHESCTTENVLSAVSGCQGDAFFKFESFVLHVQCATVQDAQTLLACAVASGYRNSGISISNRGKFVTAIRSTHGLEVPLTHNGEILVSEKYIEHLVKLSSVKMSENFSRIERLFENLKITLVNQNKTTKSNCKKTRKSRKEQSNRQDINSQDKVVPKTETDGNCTTNCTPINITGGINTENFNSGVTSEENENAKFPDTGSDCLTVDSKQTCVEEHENYEITDLFNTQNT